MKRALARLSQRYETALREYVKQGPRAGTRPGRDSGARGVGGKALAAGLCALELARIHERALVALDLTNSENGMLKRSREFFAEAITPIEETHRAALEARAHLDQLTRKLGRRTVELATASRYLKEEITQRRAIERLLRDSKEHYGELLDQAREMQEQMRRLSHQILSTQEEERKKISRELHDVIAQTLTGINVQLAKLKTEAAVNTGSIERNISHTQKLVEKSVDLVHQFARELRPTVLDDLGLIPALHTFMKSFTQETGIRVSLTAFAAIEQMTGPKRTVLYRVAQEALTNVARHAQASRAEVKIQKLDDKVCMKIRDVGRGFRAEQVLHSKKTKRLGLLGMRERVEMVGGKLTIKSAAGKGTLVVAEVPFNNHRRTRGGGYRTR